MMMQYKQRRRRRSSAIGLLSIAILASLLCLNKLVNFIIPIDDDTNLQSYQRQLLIDNDLLTTLHSNCNYNNNETDEDYNLEAANAANISYEISHSSDQTATIQNYTLSDTLNESHVYEHTFCLLLYDPPTNKFLILYSHNHRYENSNRKLWKAIRNFTYLLRQVFPNRFTKENKELIIPIGSGDYPQLNKFKLPHTEGIAPVLQFGSVFRDTNLYPNMIGMPMPEPHHLYCFSKWVASSKKTVCNELRELEFSGEFDSLIVSIYLCSYVCICCPALLLCAYHVSKFKLGTYEKEHVLTSFLSSSNTHMSHHIHINIKHIATSSMERNRFWLSTIITATSKSYQTIYELLCRPC